MNILRISTLVLTSVAAALLTSVAILILLPVPVFERLLVSALLFPLLAAGFAIYLKWHSNIIVPTLAVAGISLLSIIIITLGAPIHL